MSAPLDISLLYVEDEPAVRQSITRSLSTVVENIASVENGLEALQLLENASFDLIVTDIRMPKMDGLHLIEALREKGINLPIVITSAFNDIDYFKKAIDLKVEKFISKPIRVKDLIDLIAAFAKRISDARSLLSRQQELEHYRQAVDATSFVIRIDPQGNIVTMNKDIARYLTGSADEKAGEPTLATLFAPKLVASLLEQTNALDIFHRAAVLTYGGAHYNVQLTAFASLLYNEAVQEITVILNDITPLLQEKEQMINRLFMDELTGLPNRQKLFHDLREHEGQKAIFIIDIERFSNINYFYGFEVGDTILKQMSVILKQYWPSPWPKKLYRSEADHFVIVTELAETFSKESVRTLAADLVKHIESVAFALDDSSINVDVTIGGSCSGGHDLYTEALMALVTAKGQHRSTLCFNELTGVKERFNLNLTIQQKIKKALEGEQIVNYYQPIVDGDKRLVKYEALVRMRDPENHEQILTPAMFLEIAKQSKYYFLLTQTVIRNVFRDFGDGAFDVSINLSFDDIVNPEISRFLEEQLKAYPRARITVELLENEGFKDIQKTIDFCQQIKAYGVSISIDDFGSGYSNFSRFFEIPADILKIDGSLVKRVHDERGKAVLRAITTFARNFGFTTVAEFVEDEAIFEALKPLDVDLFQGNYFSMPKPLEHL